ncbi:hypothetical protein ACFRR7_36925, partial [Streptomyces sp. NPDC056909]|uniref:hypothetical protein n=1 Tax=Streptomyces sp. NPDC056909 TaxID=3345963 RepID=UPI0036C461A6
MPRRTGRTTRAPENRPGGVWPGGTGRRFAGRPVPSALTGAAAAFSPDSWSERARAVVRRPGTSPYD